MSFKKEYESEALIEEMTEIWKLEAIGEYRSNPTWTTKEGEVIELKDLEDSHLPNIIALLERNNSRAVLANSITYTCLIEEKGLRGLR